MTKAKQTMATVPPTHPSCATLHESASTPQPITPVMMCAKHVHRFPDEQQETREGEPWPLSARLALPLTHVFVGKAREKLVSTGARGVAVVVEFGGGGELQGVAAVVHH